jgi:hypothetical protein
MSTCVGLRRGKTWERLIEDAAEQVAQGCVRESSLRFRGPGGDHAIASFPRGIETGEPQGGLSDPGTAFEDERGRPVFHRLEESS